MRQTLILLLLVSILLPAIQCSNKDNIQSLNGKTELLSLIDTVKYPMPMKYSKKLPIPETDTTDTLVPVFDITVDTLKWIYEFPPGDSSCLSIVINGWVNVDYKSSHLIIGDSIYKIVEEQYPIIKDIVLANTFLGVEARANNTAGTVFIPCDAAGVFHDTVPVINSLQPELIFIENSTLFVGFNSEVFETVPLENPW